MKHIKFIFVLLFLSLSISANHATFADTSVSIESVAADTWSRLIGATWYDLSKPLGTAQPDHEYSYSGSNDIDKLISACHSENLYNVYGWYYSKMNKVVNGKVVAQQGVPFTLRVYPEITWTMKNVWDANFWSSWWFDDNRAIPYSSLENVSAKHVFRTLGLHTAFVLENFQDGMKDSVCGNGLISHASYSCSKPYSCNYISVNVAPDHAPEAVEVADQYYGTTKTFFSFSAGNSSDPDGNALSYTWHFGDGSVAHGENVKHQYATGGNANYLSYTVTLTATDGFMSDQTTAAIHVKNADMVGCSYLTPGTLCK